MPAKSVQLPASAVEAIALLEKHTKASGLSVGSAAAELIVRGANTAVAAASATPAHAEALSMDQLLALIMQRFEERPDQSGDLAAAIERADAAEARAKAAEDRLAAAKALFA